MEARSQFRLGVCGTAAIALSLLAIPRSAPAAPRVEAKDYQVEYLISDGSVESRNEDASLKNGWGLASSETGPWWVAANGMDMSVVYDGVGAVQDLHVAIPGSPTGVVHSSGDGFLVTDGSVSAPAQFLFATENGSIAGYSSSVGPAAPDGQAYTVVDRAGTGAIYKGLAIASTLDGDRLYATDFHNARIDVFDATYALVAVPGAFVDPKLPAGYAPFGIQTLSGRIFVSFAKQDANAADEIAGQGLGIVDVFDTDGMFVARIGAHGQLNAPWGMAIAPADFGSFGGKLLVGNFGDGSIVAYTLSDDMRKAVPSGVLRDAAGKVLHIDGLWGIAFGNGSLSGPTNALYFAAGPAGESHGSFGRVTVPATP